MMKQGKRNALTRHCVVLKSEMKTAMRLLGVETVDQMGPQHVSCIMKCCLVQSLTTEDQCEGIGDGDI
jgi:hypothetical protein